MKVTDLIMNFRMALFVLIPSIERVGIPWKRPDAYDEWDNIAAALYQALIVEPLRSCLPEADRNLFSLPDYDMVLPSYMTHSVIEVLPARDDGFIKVFHALGTSDKPFDMVEWRAIGVNGLPDSDIIETTNLENVRFALRFNKIEFPGCRIEQCSIIECITDPTMII